MKVNYPKSLGQASYCPKLLKDQLGAIDQTNLKIVFKDKILYNDQNILNLFKGSEISEKEMLDLLECDALVRNKIEIEIEGIEIDPGHLFKVKGTKAILISDDEYLETKLNEDYFYEVM